MASVVQKELQKIFRSFGGDVADEELERMIADSDRIMKGLAGLLLSEAGLDESTSKPFALLDNACGIGPVSAHLQDHVDRKLLSESKVVCADFNENLVNILKRRAEKYHWINVETAVVDAQQSDFATDSFSHVTINFGMHIIPKPEAVLEDTMRILKPGGVLAFSTWHKDSEGPFSDLRSSFEALPFDAPMPNPLPMTPNGKPQWADPEGVEGELRAHGFVNIKVQAVPHLVRVNSAEDFLQMYRTKKEWMVNAYWNEDSKKRAQGMLDEHILNHLKEKYNGEGWDVSWTVVLATCEKPI